MIPMKQTHVALIASSLLMISSPALGNEWPFELLVDLELTGIPLFIPPPITAPPIELPGSNPTQFLRVGNQLYFTADDRTHGAELWVTDGTAAGTRLVFDLCPGDCSSGPVLWGVLNDDLVFLADDGLSGPEPWATDGTAEGTRQLADICPGECGARFHDGFSWLREYSPENATVADGRLFFIAAAPETGRELWMTDGTPAGTQPATDICEGPCHGIPSSANGPLATVGDRVFFWGEDEPDREALWATDGETVQLIHDFCPGEDEVRTRRRFTVVNGRLVLGANCESEDGILWATDGTADGSEVLAELPDDENGDAPWVWDLILLQRDRALVRLQYFASSQPNQLWITDGTPGGTFPFFDDLPDSFRPMIRFGKKAALASNPIWITDGSPDGTRQIDDLLWHHRVGAAGDWLLVYGTDFFATRGLFALQEADDLQLVNSDLQVGSGVFSNVLETGVLPGALVIPAYVNPNEGAEPWIAPWFRPELQPTFDGGFENRSFVTGAGRLP